MWAWTAFFVALSMIVARRLPSRGQIAVLHLLHAAGVVLLFRLGERDVVEDWQRYRAGVLAADSMIFEVVVFGVVLLAFSAAFVRRSVALARRERTAHLAEAALAALALPLSLLTRGEPLFLYVAMLAAAPLLLWSSPRLRLELGGACEEIVTRVTAAGAIGVPALAKELGVSRRGLQRVLLREIDLPLVWDRQGDRLLSPAVAKAEWQICAHCGGAVHVAAGQALVVCAYCDRPFVLSLEKPRPRVPPLVVALYAELVFSLFAGLSLVAAAFGLAVLVLDQTMPREQPFGVAEYTVIGVFIGLWLAMGAFFSSGWKRGVRGWMLRPLIRSRPLIRYHFGALPREELLAELSRRGTWPLRDFAKHLDARYDEAVDLARVLAVNDAVAIYDRRHDRLCARGQSISGVCKRCGGILGPQRCQHCGALP